MSDNRPFDPDRRALLGAGGALLAAAALPFPAFAQSGGAAKSSDRHHRIGQDRRHGRLALGQGRARGHVLLAPSRGAQGHGRGAGETGPCRKCGAGDRLRQHAVRRHTLWRAAAARPGVRRPAQGQNRARRRQRQRRPRRRHRRRGREERHRRHFAEIPAGHASGARLQHAVLHDPAARGQPAAAAFGDPDRRRRSGFGQGRGRAGARRRFRSGGGGRVGQGERVPARRAGLRPECHRARA